MRHIILSMINYTLDQWCQDFFFGGPNFDFQKPWRSAANIASSSPLRFVAKQAFFPNAGGEKRHFSVRPAGHNMRPAGRNTSAARESRGPHFAISRATLQCSFLDPQRATFHGVAGHI